MTPLAILMLGACDPAAPVPTPPPVDTDVPLDCTAPPVPVEFVTHTGFSMAEDFDIDGSGLHISLSGTGNLLALDGDGGVELISPNVTAFGACTRELPDGNFVICDTEFGLIHHVDRVTGEKTLFASDLGSPNGGTVDSDGFVYISDFARDTVHRFSPDGSEMEVLGSVFTPNGVALSVDEQRLYVGSFGPGELWVLRRDGDGWGAPELHGGLANGGDFDAIAVDACERVYAGDWETGHVWRFSPDGSEAEILAEVPSSWTSSMRWGTGVGRWDRHSLFLTDREQGRLFEFPLGVPGHVRQGVSP